MISKVNEFLADQFGERAVYGQFGVIVATYEDGRSRIGGTILAPMAKTKVWERWKGTAILIPDSIETCHKSLSGQRIDTMMLSYLGMDNDEDYKPWKKQWTRTTD